MRREKGSKPGDIVLVDFGRVCVLQAANDLGGYLSNRDFDKKGSKHDWPPLDHRKGTVSRHRVIQRPARHLLRWQRDFGPQAAARGRLAVGVTDYRRWCR